MPLDLLCRHATALSLTIGLSVLLGCTQTQVGGSGEAAVDGKVGGQDVAPLVSSGFIQLIDEGSPLTVAFRSYSFANGCEAQRLNYVDETAAFRTAINAVGAGNDIGEADETLTAARLASQSSRFPADYWTLNVFVAANVDSDVSGTKALGQQATLELCHQTGAPRPDDAAPLGDANLTCFVDSGGALEIAQFQRDQKFVFKATSVPMTLFDNDTNAAAGEVTVDGDGAYCGEMEQARATRTAATLDYLNALAVAP